MITLADVVSFCAWCHFFSFFFHGRREIVILITPVLGIFLKPGCSAFASVLFLPLHQRDEGRVTVLFSRSHLNVSPLTYLAM